MIVPGMKPTSTFAFSVSMQSFRSLLFAILLVGAAVASLAAPPVWPQEQSDLKPDPRITFGQLENGFRYLLLPHDKPSQRITVCLLVKVGSFHETKDERGYAHYVEHMAFNSTHDFPGDSAIRTIQRLGLSFGNGTNGTTSLFETVYQLENLPATDATALPSALKIMRNFADGALFLDTEVRKERDIILAELRTNAGRMAEYWQNELEFLPPFGMSMNPSEVHGVFTGRKIAWRSNVIGTENVIRRAKAKTLRAFYDRWYRPERMILAIAGEIDPGVAAAQVRQIFESCATRSPAPKAPAVEPPPVSEQAKARTFTVIADQEPRETIYVASALPRNTPDAAERRRLETVGRISLSLVNQRLNRSRQVPAEFDSLISHQIEGWQMPLLLAKTSPGNWQAAALALETEVQRAIQHGFSDEELKLCVQKHHQYMARIESDAPNRTAGELARALTYATARGVVFTTAEDNRRLMDAELDRVTPDACRKALRQLFPPERTVVILSGPIKDGTGLSDSLQTLRTTRLEPYKMPAVKPFPYTDFGPPGKVTGEQHDAALDCWFMQFANGVRLNFKHTDFEPGRASLQLNFGYGDIGVPPGKSGLQYGILALILGGLRDLSLEEMDDAFADHPGAMRCGNAADFLFIIAESKTKELQFHLQLATADLTAPAFRESSESKMRDFIEAQLAPYEKTAAQRARVAVMEFLFSQHHATIADTRKLSYADFRDWLMPQLAQSPIEITIVGDVPREQAVEAVSRTLGALPMRPVEDGLAERRHYVPPVLPHRETIKFKGKDSVSSVALAWPMLDQPGYADDCHFALLAHIVEDRLRLRLREEMGETYAPSIVALKKTALTPTNWIFACRAETAPRHANRVAKAMRQAIDTLVREGVTPDELERARQPLEQETEAGLKNNGWWLATLSEGQSKPQFTPGVADRVRLYRTATIDDINACARALLVKDRCCEFQVKPE